MTAVSTLEPPPVAPATGIRILVFSTNTISDPGIDLAGSNHLHYTPG